MASRAAFLDRDGTINREVEYLSSVDQLELIDGAARGVRELNLAGFKVVVITNQAGVARGYLDEETLHDIHSALRDQLARRDATIDAIYYCPHHPTSGASPYRRECECRKPKPGMLLQAAEELDIDLARSYLVGDKVSDLDAGTRVGCASVLVRTGYGNEVERDLSNQQARPSFIADDLRDAATWILKQQTTP